MGDWSAVAGRLLQERLLLTALELHTELVEAGREEPQLREFFSNPANFERPPPTIVRCPSQATLDSLDLTRMSEDSERGGDDVAVLEFELRKARETINALRANLTQATEYDTGSSDRDRDVPSGEAIKPHERRALNFLVYEYLLRQDCKLTSITFSDEVPEQDFECWDDVGLNIPRPPDLLSLYRRESIHRPSVNAADAETQIDDLSNEELSVGKKSITETDEEIMFLKKQILALETDKVNYQKLYDAALASLNSLTSPTSDVPSSETTLYNRDDDSAEVTRPIDDAAYSCAGDNAEDEMQPLPQTATQNYYSGSVSTNSLTPDRFEMIDNEKNGSSNRDESNVSSYEPIAVDDQILNSPGSFTDSALKHKSSLTTLDDSISLNEQMENEWEQRRKVSSFYKTTNLESNADAKTEVWIDSDIHTEYKEALMNFCDLQYTKDNIIFKDLPSSNQPISLQEYIYIVSSTLPKIIPNILIVKRDEVLSLLICTIFLHPDQGQRDKLLQLLMNFKKKMEKEDRSLIILGLVILMQWNSIFNCGLDSDVLGYLWEMLNSKSAEKRLLGAEASVALAPYISLDLVNSLLLSMVLSMCDSKENAIRKQGLLGALIITPTATSTKYAQLENIFFNLAFDTSFSDICIDTFAPILARSTLLNGTFHSEFYPRLLEKLTAKHPNQNEAIALLKILNSVVIFNLFYVINVDIVKISKIQSVETKNEKNRFYDYLQEKPFHNPQYLFKNEIVNPFELIKSFYDITRSDYNISWDEREWFINQCFKRTLEILVGQPFSTDEKTICACSGLFENFCLMFGISFAKYIIKPALVDELTKIEQKMIKSDFRNKSSLMLISIYLSILTVFDDNEKENVISTINKWSISCGMCSISPKFIGISIVQYSCERPEFFQYALTAMRQCIVHSKEQVRSFVGSLFEYVIQNCEYSEETLGNVMIPAVVTLLGDGAVSVKCNAIKCLGEAILRSKSWQTVSEKCWLTLEDLVVEEKSNGTLGAHVTTCLAKTFFKILFHEKTQCNKILPNTVMLCYSPVFSTENTTAINTLLSELLPVIALSSQSDISEHFVQNSLLPALRKFEGLNQKILSEHRLTIESLIHKLAVVDQSPSGHAHIPSSHTLPSILANSESVGRRVTQLFQHSKPAMNLQNIFKKK